MKKQTLLRPNLVQQLPTMDIYKTNPNRRKVLTDFRTLFFRYKGAVVPLPDCRPTTIEGYDLQYSVTATTGLLLQCTFKGSILETVSTFVYTEPGARTMTTTFKKARETVAQLQKLVPKLNKEELLQIKQQINKISP